MIPVIKGTPRSDLLYISNIRHFGTIVVYGYGGNDTIKGRDYQDKLYGHAGHDRLYGYGGHDYLYGGYGKDRLYAGYGNDFLKGDKGNDILKGGHGKDKLYGGKHNDKLYGGKHNDLLKGEHGKDKLYGEHGHDKLYGGHHNDVLKGGSGNDKLYGQNHHDKLFGGRGHDILVGGHGNDYLSGDKGHDKLYGSAGADKLIGGYGVDRLYGGAGNDTLIFNVAINAINNKNDYYNGGTDTDKLNLLINLKNPPVDLGKAIYAFMLHDKSTVFDFSQYAPEVKLSVINIETLRINGNGFELRGDSIIVRGSNGNEYALPYNYAPVVEELDDIVVHEGDLDELNDNEFNYIEGQINVLERENEELTFSLKGEAPLGFELFADGRFILDATDSQYNHLNVDQTREHVVAFTVEDTFGHIVESSINVIIKGSNTAPVAVIDQIDISENDIIVKETEIALNLLDNDSDIDHNHTLSIKDYKILNATITLDGEEDDIMNDIHPDDISVDSDGHLSFNTSDYFDILNVGDNAVINIEYTMQDEHGSEKTEMVVITIAGENDVPVIDGSSPSNDLIEDDLSLATSHLSITDKDSGHVVSFDMTTMTGADAVLGGFEYLEEVDDNNQVIGRYLSKQGTYGYLLVNLDVDNDQLSYMLNNRDFDTQALNQDEVVADNFIVTLIDDNDAQVTYEAGFNITGRNDESVISVEATTPNLTIISESGIYTLSGQYLVSDVDSLDNPHIDNVPNTNTSYGVYSLTDGHWQYTLNNEHPDVVALNGNQSLSDSFTLIASDGNEKVISINIRGANNSPIAKNDETSIDENQAIDNETLIFNVILNNDTDPDGDILEASLINVVAKEYLNGDTVGDQFNLVDGVITLDTDGALHLNPGTHFDYLYLNDKVEISVNYSISDGLGGTDTAVATVTINGSDDAPIISVAVDDGDNADLTQTDVGLSINDTLTLSGLDIHDDITMVVSKVVESGQVTGLTKSNAELLAMLSVPALISTDNVMSNMTQDTMTWTFASGTETFQYLADKETLTLTYTVTATDLNGQSDSHDIVIAITGTNDVPVISVENGDLAGDSLIESANSLMASHTLTTTDLDLKDTVSVAVTSVSASGTVQDITNQELLNMMLVTSGSFIDETETVDTFTWTFNSGEKYFNYLAKDETLTLTYVMTASDSQGATTSQNVVIDITGSNNIPLISVASGAETSKILTERDIGLSATDTLTITDTDLNDTVTATVKNVIESGAVSGLSNTALLAMMSVTSELVLDSTSTEGILTWSFDSGTEAFNYLADGESLTLTYEIAVNDGNTGMATQEVVITINGTNDVPVMSVATNDTDTDTLTETNTTLSTSGTLTTTDLDKTDTVYVVVTSVVESGKVSGLSNSILKEMLAVTNVPFIDKNEISNVFNWQFSSGTENFNYLAAGETLTLRYQVEVKDSPSETSDTHTIEININGTNDAPVISVDSSDTDSQTLSETNDILTTTGTLTTTDIDFGDSVSVAITAVNIDITNVRDGADLSALDNATLLAMMSVPAEDIIDNSQTKGTFNWTFDAGKEAFNQLAEGDTLILTYTLTVTDGEGATDTHPVVLNIRGTNDAPDVVIDTETIDEDPNVDGNHFLLNVLANDSDIDSTGSLQVTTIDAITTKIHVPGKIDADFNLNANAIRIDNNGDMYVNLGEELNHLSVGESATIEVNYTVSDNPVNGKTSSAIARITVTGSNDKPIVNGEVMSQTVTENTLIINQAPNQNFYFNVLANDKDPDQNDNLTVRYLNQYEARVFIGDDIDGEAYTLNTAKVLISSDGVLSFSPGVDFDHLNDAKNMYDNSDSAYIDVYYEVVDEAGEATQGVARINITALNDAPSVTFQTLTTHEDINLNGNKYMINVLGEDADVDVGDTISLKEINSIKATLQLQGEPETPFQLKDTTVNLKADDSLDINIGNDFNFLGVNDRATLTITYFVTDNQDSTLSQVEITIEGRNDAPIVVSEERTDLTENTILEDRFNVFNVLANDSDPDNGDSLTARVVSIDAKEHIYDATDPTSLDYIDGLAVNATEMNKVIVAIDEKGNLHFNPGSVFDYLNTNDHAIVEIIYEIDDGHGGIAQGTARLRLDGTNDAPIVQHDYVDTFENEGAVTINVLHNSETPDNDIDSTGFIYVSNLLSIDGYLKQRQQTTIPYNVTDKINIELPSDGNLLATFNDNFNFLGVDEYIDVVVNYMVSDESGASALSKSTIRIQGVNNAPIVDTSATTIYENDVIDGIAISYNVLDKANDIDTNDTLTASLISYSVEDSLGNNITLDTATLNINADGKVLFNPGTDFDYLTDADSATITLQFEVNDGYQGITTQNATINIQGENDGPYQLTLPSGSITDLPNTIEIAESNLTGFLPAADPEGQPLTHHLLDDSDNWVGFIQGQYGTLEIINGGYVYTPDKALINTMYEGETALDKFTFITTDGDTFAESQYVVEITGGNEDGIIYVSPQRNIVIEDNLLKQSTDVSIRLDDPDTGDSLSYVTAGWTPVEGADEYYSMNLIYGTAFLDVINNKVHYVLDNAREVTQALSANEKVQESVTLEVTDGTGTISKEIVFDVFGSNDKTMFDISEQTEKIIDGGNLSDTVSVTIDRIDTLDEVQYDEELMQSLGWVESNVGWEIEGLYGSVVLDTTGETHTLTYDLGPAAQQIGQGEIAVDDFKIGLRETEYGGNAASTIESFFFEVEGKNNQPTVTISEQEGILSYQQDKSSIEPLILLHPDNIYSFDQTRATKFVSFQDLDKNDMAKYDHERFLANGWNFALQGENTPVGVMEEDGYYKFYSADGNSARFYRDSGKLEYNYLSNSGLASYDQTQALPDVTIYYKDKYDSYEATTNFTLSGPYQPTNIAKEDAITNSFFNLGTSPELFTIDKLTIFDVATDSGGNSIYMEYVNVPWISQDIVIFQNTENYLTPYGYVSVNASPDPLLFSQGITDHGIFIRQLLDRNRIQHLAEGERGEMKIELTYSYPGGAPMTKTTAIYFEGSNDAPTVKSDFHYQDPFTNDPDDDIYQFGTIYEDADPSRSWTYNRTATMNLVISDIDNGDTATLDLNSMRQNGWYNAIENATEVLKYDGVYGEATLIGNHVKYTKYDRNDPRFTDSIDAFNLGDTIWEPLTVYAIDNHGMTGSSVIRFRIEGVNDAPIITHDAPEPLIIGDGNYNPITIPFTIMDIEGNFLSTPTEPIYTYDWWYTDNVNRYTETMNGLGWHFVSESSAADPYWQKFDAYGVARLYMESSRIEYQLDSTAAESIIPGEVVDSTLTIFATDNRQVTQSFYGTYWSKYDTTYHDIIVKIHGPGYQLDELIEDDELYSTTSLDMEAILNYLQANHPNGPYHIDISNMLENKGWRAVDVNKIAKDGEYGTAILTVDVDNNINHRMEYLVDKVKSQSIADDELGSDYFDLDFTNFQNDLDPEHNGKVTYTMHFDIQGNNDAPTVTFAEQVGALVEDDIDNISATMNVTIEELEINNSASLDVDMMLKNGWRYNDNNDLVFQATFGTVVYSLHQITYTLDNSKTQSINHNDSVLDEVTIYAVDNFGMSGDYTTSFAIQGVNDAPEAKLLNGGELNTILTAGSGKQTFVIGEDLDNIDALTIQFDKLALDFTQTEMSDAITLTENHTIAEIPAATLEKVGNQVILTIDTNDDAYTNLVKGESKEIYFSYTLDDGIASRDNAFVLSVESTPNITYTPETNLTLVEDASVTESVVNISLDDSVSMALDVNAMLNADWSASTNDQGQLLLDKRLDYGKASLNTVTNQLIFTIDNDAYEMYSLNDGDTVQQSFDILTTFVDETTQTLQQTTKIISFDVEGKNDRFVTYITDSDEQNLSEIILREGETISGKIFTIDNDGSFIPDDFLPVFPTGFDGLTYNHNDLTYSYTAPYIDDINEGDEITIPFDFYSWTLIYSTSTTYQVETYFDVTIIGQDNVYDYSNALSSIVHQSNDGNEIIMGSIYNDTLGGGLGYTNIDGGEGDDVVSHLLKVTPKTSKISEYDGGEGIDTFNITGLLERDYIYDDNNELIDITDPYVKMLSPNQLANFKQKLVDFILDLKIHDEAVFDGNLNSLDTDFKAAHFEKIQIENSTQILDIDNSSEFVIEDFVSEVIDSLL